MMHSKSKAFEMTNPILSSKPKLQIVKITNRHVTKRIYGQPSEQLFLKWLSLSYSNQTKYNLHFHKVKTQHRD